MRFQAPQLYATCCAYHLWGNKYQPGTIINVGVGSCPELAIWRWQFPNSKLVGIDPKRQNRWDADYVQAAAVSPLMRAHCADGQTRYWTYCRVCESINCDCKRRVPLFAVTTIDEVAANYPPPYFLWLDIEGGELTALLGAERTLEQTKWLSLEVKSFGWQDQVLHRANLDAFLKSRGYQFVYAYPGLPDRLYRKGRR